MEDSNSFVVMDFETGNPNRASACSVGIISVENGIIVDEFQSLIYNPLLGITPKFTQIHGITNGDVCRADIFPDVLSNEIKHRIDGKIIVAHNESFDRGVLRSSMEYYDLNYNDLNIINPDKWECTLKIYRNYKFLSGALKYLCNDLNIPLQHHDSLSDSRACAHLYYKHKVKDFKAMLSYK